MKNNTVFAIVVVLIALSASVNIAVYREAGKLQERSITAKIIDNQASMSICLNSPPAITGHSCQLELLARLDGRLRDNYTCSINATDANDQSIHFESLSDFLEIDNLLGNITLASTIMGNGTLGKRNMTGSIVAIDSSSCPNNHQQLDLIFNLTYTGGVVLLQNYTSNAVDYLILKEGYTTYHKSLDEYFMDIDGFELEYDIEYLDLHCFKMNVEIANSTHVVRYRPAAESATDMTGPCRARIWAQNPYGLKNQTNIFNIFIQRPELPQSGTPQSNRESKGGGGGGGSTGQAGSMPSQCRLWDVECTEWDECMFSFQNSSDIFSDGIQERECIWTTNCPGELEPEQKRMCDYRPTCFDKMQNCHENPDNTTECEEGIDCGGPCESCPTCSDFIRNQGETGIDCGGPCGPCATCFDEIKNCVRLPDLRVVCEEAIDCGGACTACPTCSDGLRNCHVLDNGTRVCEEGIDCGGLCEKCSRIESPAQAQGFQHINLLLISLAALAFLYPAKLAWAKAMIFLQKKYMEYLKKRILHRRTKHEHNYIAHFDAQVKELKSEFDMLTADVAKKEGDRILGSETTGYNIDRYSVSFDNDYADILTDNSIRTINYAMYLGNTDHGRRILGELLKSGISARYRLCKRTSAVLWDDRWERDKNLKYEVIGGKTIARSVEYIISFMPSSSAEAGKIVKTLEIYGKGTQKEKIQGAWEVPDIRVTGEDPILDYEKNILNVKAVSGQKLLILTKDKPLTGYKHTPVWINPSLSKFIK